MPADDDRSDEPRGGPFAGLMRLFGGREEPSEAPPPSVGHDGVDIVDQAEAFQTLRVSDVMTPRADVVALEISAPFDEVVRQFAETEHSRVPVYRETLDEPVGVVHIKDVFKLMAPRGTMAPPEWDEQVLRRIRREVLYVPASMRAADLLLRMQARRIHMALVIDEFGGTDGLVTLEDLLERLVGEISDEHDEDEGGGAAPIVEDEGGWMVDGRVLVEDLEAAMGGVDLAPPDIDEEIDTVAGLVTALAGRVPRPRERIPHPGGFALEVAAGDPRRVKRVRVHRPPIPAAADFGA